MKRRSRQLTLPLPQEKPRHGGPRVGAGRPNRTDQHAHVRRPRFEGSREPVHVTVRFAPHVWNLRSQRGFACVARALRFERALGELRVVHFSVQGNHLHLIAEAQDHRVLARRMQGFGIRLARALNALMGRRGRVYGDRYHARPLKSARQTFHAVRYVLQNHAKHAAQAGRTATRVDRFASSSLSAALEPRSSRAPPDRATHAFAGAPELAGPSVLGADPKWPAAPHVLLAEPVTWFLRSGFRQSARSTGALRSAASAPPA